MVCHSLLQWTTFCQTSPPWPIRLGWLHTAWLSFIKLDKAVVHVIRLASFLWLWFQCVCPLMPSRNTYGCKSWTEKSWVLKNWCFWTVVLEKTLESHLDCKEIQPVHSKGDQSWMFIGRTDAKAETPILWPPHVKSWLIGKDPDAGRNWEQEEKGTTEDEMAEWHHWLDGHDFE